MSRTKRCVPYWAKGAFENNPYYTEKQLQQNRILNGYDKKPSSYIYLSGKPCGWKECVGPKSKRWYKRYFHRTQRRFDIIRHWKKEYGDD